MRMKTFLQIMLKVYKKKKNNKEVTEYQNNNPNES